MKPLNEYVEQARTELFDKEGAFFAFSNEQLDEHKIEGVKYVSLGYGLIAPKENAKRLMEDMDKLHFQAINLRLAEYGLSRIAQYELANYESQISMDWSTAHDVLKDYGITDEQMQEEWKIFWNNCVENDLF